MIMDRPTHGLASRALLTFALVVSACGQAGDEGVDNDRAGGTGLADPTVLTMAQPNDGAPPPQLVSWADEVARLSDGSLEIDFTDGWRHGETEYETGTIKDVQDGEVDLGWVGARAFDIVGVTSFQALMAPMLIDSYDLQGAVFEAGIPMQMLDSLEAIDLVGIGVLPGPMRKMLGVSKPFMRPADFENMVVGIQDSDVTASSLGALGATAKAVPSGASLEGLDGYEQQLASIVGNNYPLVAGYVTGNINLWPRPLVIFANADEFASLTASQQAALRDAASAAVPAALTDSRAEDDNATPAVCSEGMTITVASDADLEALQAAFEPVYRELKVDPLTRAHIAAIVELKRDLGAPPESPACPPETLSDPEEAGASIPDGRYQATLTADDWSGMGAATVGVFTMVFSSGELTILQPETDEVGFAGTYTVFRDRIEVTNNDDTVTARWTFDGEELTFSDISPADSPFEVVWGSHPWVMVDSG